MILFLRQILLNTRNKNKKSIQVSSSSLTPILMTFAVMTLAACNPISKTKLGDDVFSNVVISLNNSTLTVSNSQVATNATVTVTLSLKDGSGEDYVSTRPTVTFSYSGGTSVGTLSAVTNNDNGTYSATFTGVTPGTATTLHAQVNGEEILSTLPTLQVTTGNYSLSNSLVSVASGSILSGASTALTLTVKDSSSTQLPGGGLTVLFANSGGTSTGTFSAVTDNLNGTYTATFTGVAAGSATSITATIAGSAVTSASPTITVSAGVATKLAFIVHPANTASGSTISPSITITAQDASSNNVTSWATDIVIAIDAGNNPGSGTLSGTLTKTPASGVSTFNDLSINYYGTGYKLTATSGALTTALSNSFNITATAFTYDWPFTALTTGSYTSSDWTKMQFSGGVCELIPTVQTDSSSTETTDSTFTNGTKSGVVYGTLTDGSTQGLKLGNSGSCNGGSSDCAKQDAAEIYELNSSWTPQWASLVSYWKMNESSWNGTASEVVDSNGTNHGNSVNGTTTTSTAKLGSKSGIFDGADDSVLIPYGTIGALTSGSISFWFKTSGSGVLFAIHTNSSNNRQFPISIISTGKIDATAVNSASTIKFVSQSTQTGFNDGQWHHLAYTSQSGSGGYTIYIDAVPLTMTASIGTNVDFFFANTMLASDKIKLGAKSDVSNLNVTFYSGALDEVAIWSAVLSASEVQTIYDRQKSAYSGTFTSRVMDAKSSSSWTTLSWIPTLPFFKELPDSTCATPCTHNAPESSSNYTSLVGSTGLTSDTTISTTNLVALWHLDEATGTTGAGSIKDDSGNGNNGTPTSTSLGATGKFLTAGNFDGSNSYIEVPDSATNRPSNNFTFSLWFKSNSTSQTNKYILSRNDSACAGTDQAAIIYNFVANQVEFYSVNYTGTSPRTGSQLTISDTNWHHIVYAYDGSTWAGYLDGASIFSVARTFSLSSAALTGGWYMAGACQGAAGQRVNGLIDEVAIWSRALHANEIKQLYQRGASRIKYQVRSCDDNACSGESWQGPDGTSGTYFSELNNNTTPLTGLGDIKATLPSMLFSNFTSAPSNNQYFQYRTIFESDSSTAALMPELKSTTVDPIHYDASSPSIYGNSGVSFSDLNAYAEVLGSGSCSSGVGYNLSLDKATWKYWTGAAWATANGTAAQSNTAAVINTNTATFGTQVGKGTVYVKAYLKSSGTSKCELDNIQVGGNR